MRVKEVITVDLSLRHMLTSYKIADRLGRQVVQMALERVTEHSSFAFLVASGDNFTFCVGLATATTF